MANKTNRGFHRMRQLTIPGERSRTASAVQLRAGEDFPANFSLRQVPLWPFGVRLRIPAGGSVVVMLRSADANSIMTATEVHKDGSFEIRDASPGGYTLFAMVIGGTRSAHGKARGDVGADSISALRVILQQGGEIHGRLRVEDRRRFGET